MPCPDGTFPPDRTVDCGFVIVPEDRARPNGRSITVAAAVMRAVTRRPKPDPIVFVDGGPSFGAISDFAAFSYFGGASYAEDRDVVLVDTRGTGLSVPRLGCPEFDQADEASFFAKPYFYAPKPAVAAWTQGLSACRDRLIGDGIDLASYDSAESAGDLEALRQALGYKKWNLIALSADGVLGLTYMRLYPDGIRSAIIDSGIPTQVQDGLDFWRGGTEMLEKIFAGCAANAACNASYPGLRSSFYDFVGRLQAHPARITIPDVGGKPLQMSISGAFFYEDAIYGIFPGDRFEPEHITGLISELWRAAHGELTQVYIERVSSPDPPAFDSDSFLARGKTESYRCRDSVGFITRSDLRRAAADVPSLAPYFLDPDYDLLEGGPESPAGCRVWNVGLADPVQHQPVSSTIPTLVLAGEYDLGVPAFMVRMIPRTLSNSTYVEFPAAPHIQLANYNSTSDCAREIAGRFLDNPGKRPDTSCVAALPPFDFTP